MRRTTSIPLVGLAVVGLALTGCGGSSKKDASSTGCGSTTGKTITVDIGDFKFEPTPVTVKACDSVVWKNTHNQAHTSTGNGAQTWSTGNIAPGATSPPIVIKTKGQLTYMCALHPFMKGTVEVT